MKWFKNRTLTAKYMIVSVAVLCLIFIPIGIGIISFIYKFETIPKFLAGLITGSAVTILRLVLMDKSLDKTSQMAENKAKNHAQLGFFIRYFITIAYAVLIIIFNKYIGVFGGVLGLFFMQISAYIANYFINVRVKNKPYKKIDLSYKEFDEISDENGDVEDERTRS